MAKDTVHATQHRACLAENRSQGAKDIKRTIQHTERARQ